MTDYDVGWSEARDSIIEWLKKKINKHGEYNGEEFKKAFALSDTIPGVSYELGKMDGMFEVLSALRKCEDV